jgi:hypothetical protein
MSVSVDGFIADREGAFGWTAPNEEQFRFISAGRSTGAPAMSRTDPFVRVISASSDRVFAAPTERILV